MAGVSAGSLQFGHSQKAVENWYSIGSRASRPLQFGHSQKAVENMGRKRCVRADSATLQFGHSQKAVENVREHGYVRQGPGFNSATAKRPWRTSRERSSLDRAASIRPQPKGRGEPVPHSRPARTSPQLQFGHSQKAVENSGIEREVLPRSFNSATAKRPWRTASADAGEWTASLRPQPKGRGEQRPADARGPAASIRPQPKGRGEPPRAAVLARLAASIRPQPKGRGEPAECDARPPELALQFGHSQKAVENP